MVEVWAHERRLGTTCLHTWFIASSGQTSVPCSSSLGDWLPQSQKHGSCVPCACCRKCNKPRLLSWGVCSELSPVPSTFTIGLRAMLGGGRQNRTTSGFGNRTGCSFYLPPQPVKIDMCAHRLYQFSKPPCGLPFHTSTGKVK